MHYTIQYLTFFKPISHLWSYLETEHHTPLLLSSKAISHRELLTHTWRTEPQWIQRQSPFRRLASLATSLTFSLKSRMLTALTSKFSFSLCLKSVSERAHLQNLREVQGSIRMDVSCLFLYLCVCLGMRGR